MASAGGIEPPVLVLGAGGSGLSHVLVHIARSWLDHGLDVAAFDDADQLEDAVLGDIESAVRAGRAVVVAHRHPTRRARLAGLDALVARLGTTVWTEPLDDAALASVATAALGHALAAELLAPLAHLSGRQPALARAVASGWAPTGGPTDETLARPILDAMAARCLALSPPARQLLDLASLAPTIVDADLAAVIGIQREQLADLLDELAAAGVVDPAGRRPYPVVALARRELTARTERDRLLERLADVQYDRGLAPAALAPLLRDAGAVGPASAAAFIAAGDALRFVEPAAALGWYEQAMLVGAERATVALGRAEAAAIDGRSDAWQALDDAPIGSERDRVDACVAALEARAGRWIRAIEHYERAARAGSPYAPLLAAPGHVGLGTSAAVPAATAADATSRMLTELADASRAVFEGATVTPLVQAANAAERVAPRCVQADAPHALAAIAALVALDAGTAERLCDRGLTSGAGGQGLALRQRVVLAWAQVRSGRFEGARELLREQDGAPVDGRDRLWLAALAAALARRSGNVAALATAWASAEPLLVEQGVDVWALDAWCELAVGAARVRSTRGRPVVDELGRIVAALGSPTLWDGWLAWRRHEIAVVAEDVEGAAAASEHLGQVAAADVRIAPLARAADAWNAVLAGRVVPADIEAAADGLAARGLQWEASRLVGQAAIRVTDARLTRDLLERARDLRTAPVDDAGGAADVGALSERERDVGRLVLDGMTHKEIGAQLFISAKTVEHHVARIRTKLGVTSRAELLVALRRALSS